MTDRRPSRRPLVHAGLVLAAVVMIALVAPPADANAGHSLIQGSGSSWSANAINQWVADVKSNGIQVVFTANGSAQGRKDFSYKTNDFAVTEIGFQGRDSVTGESDTSLGREFAYLPIVSGGTSFPYQIRVRGQLVRDLRLSGETIAKIFTNRITDWSDPQITADNNGRKLPSIPIIPVVHSEGSGSSAHLTDWFDKAYPDLWRPFAGHAGLTEYYPRKEGAIAQSGSDGVMNFISSGAANGAIGYDEYSYALGKNYPVAKVANASGHFVLPDEYNVAVALTKAIINRDKSSQDYLLQDLTNVYSDRDPRTYPLSSYSYMVLATGPNDERMTTAKRQTVADFLYYSVCDGQKEMGLIGYSPLPVNLVQAGFEQVSKLKQADPGVDLVSRDVSTCNNPTFIAGQPDRNYLAEIAPMPPDCDQVGKGPCVAAGGTLLSADPETASGGPTGGAGTGPGAGAGAAGATQGAGPQAGTGQDAGATTGTVASEEGTNADVEAETAAAASVGVGDRSKGNAYGSTGASLAFALLAIALLGFVIIAPAFLVRGFARRSKDRP